MTCKCGHTKREHEYQYDSKDHTGACRHDRLKPDGCRQYHNRSK